MTKDQEHILSQVQLQVKPDEVLDESRIKLLVNFFRQLTPISDAEADEVVAELQTRLPVKMDRGSFVKDRGHVSWYYSAKKEIEPKFWNRYTTYLFKEAGFNSTVINSIDAATDEMMDLLGNPKDEQFDKKGLVIGDVQSGKTSTYLALMNKAADANYHIIILLTGTIEKLRRQTQGRTDEGFVGLDSTAFNQNKDSVYVGVGNIDKSVHGWAITSTTSDFNTSTANKLSGQLGSITDPVVFVLKKNKSVLEKLEQWLRLYNKNPVTGTIDMPLLLIDDEADNASVSTKTGEDPTTINKNIRKILNLFSKSSYVGFTATPYANIFIDPDSTQEMLADDLFPRDFIYALEAPSNYIGAASIFPETGKNHSMIKNNDDCEYYVPLKHKKDYEPGILPLSMKKAIASFFLANTIRDLRGDSNKHRTMMVNISVYIDVQKRIAEQLDTYVRELQREIRNYYKMGDMALQYASFVFLKEVYKKYYSDCGFSWAQIQAAIWPAIAPIVVRYVNGGNAPKNLNYDENEEHGLRLIAVGGYSLSRGLTLEGLCVSYFYRNTKMYDTLMQMGRWFGYRPRYEDLCQIWINDNAVEWYSYISEAADELKREVRRMQSEQRTPADFGLCVRSDQAALLVTARNKMKTAKDYTMTVNLNGRMVETPYLHTVDDILKKNLKITEDLFLAIENDETVVKKFDSPEMALKNKPQYLNVPKDYIVDYLVGFQSHSMNTFFHPHELVEMIKKAKDGSLDKWDVVIATGSGDLTHVFGSYTVNCVMRSFEIRDDLAAYQMSGSKSRLGNRSYAVGGMLEEDAKAIKEAAEAEDLKVHNEIRRLNQEVYFKSQYSDKVRNPLLVIYPVQLKPKEKGDKAVRESLAADNIKFPLIGISVGIPAIKGKEPKQYQYKINLIKYRELMGLDEPDETDDTIED